MSSTSNSLARADQMGYDEHDCQEPRLTLYSYRQRVCVILVVEMLWTHKEHAQQILTTVVTRIFVDKSTNNAKPNSICFYHNISVKENVLFFQGAT